MRKRCVGLFALALALAVGAPATGALGKSALSVFSDFSAMLTGSEEPASARLTAVLSADADVYQVDVPGVVTLQVEGFDIPSCEASLCWVAGGQPGSMPMEWDGAEFTCQFVSDEPVDVIIWAVVSDGSTSLESNSVDISYRDLAASQPVPEPAPAPAPEPEPTPEPQPSQPLSGYTATLEAACPVVVAGQSLGFSMPVLDASGSSLPNPSSWQAELCWNDQDGGYHHEPMRWDASEYAVEASDLTLGTNLVWATLSDESGVVLSTPTVQVFCSDDLSQMLTQIVMLGLTERVELRGLDASEDDFNKAWDGLSNNPRTAHRYGGSHWAFEKDGVTYISAVQAGYRVSGEALESYQDDLSVAAERVMSLIDPGWSDFQKAMFVHDWLSQNVVYDHYVADNNVYTETTARTPLGALRDGRAVCAGYSSAFQLIMQMCGVPCENVDSTDMSHSWNMVQIGGTWYYMDVTWDDPDAEPDTEVSYMYCLVGEDTLSHDHYGWVPAHPAPQDMDGTGCLHYGPNVAPFDQVIGWIYDAGYMGGVDVLAYGMTEEQYNEQMNRFFGALGISVQWRYWTDDEGIVKRFRLTSLG